MAGHGKTLMNKHLIDYARAWLKIEVDMLSQEQRKQFVRVYRQRLDAKATLDEVVDRIPAIELDSAMRLVDRTKGEAEKNS